MNYKMMDGRVIHAEPTEWIRFKKAALFLDLSKRNLIKFIVYGINPCSYFGDKIYFDVSVLKLFLQNHSKNLEASLGEFEKGNRDNTKGDNWKIK